MIEPPKKLKVEDADRNVGNQKKVLPNIPRLSAEEHETLELFLKSSREEAKFNLFNAKTAANMMFSERAKVAEILKTLGLENILEAERTRTQLLEKAENIAKRISSLEVIRNVDEDLNELNRRHAYLVEDFNKLNLEIAAAENSLANKHRRINELDNRIVELEKVEEIESFGFYDYSHAAEEVLKLKQQIDDVKKTAKSMVSGKTAVHATSGFTFNNSSAKGKKFVNDMTKLLLRAYNAEVENAVKSSKTKAQTLAAKKRLDKTRTDVERLGSMIDLRINDRYHRIRMKEIDLVYTYQLMKEEEAELKKEERARIQEERKAALELQNRKDKLEKEKQQKVAALQEWLKSYENPQTTLSASQLREKEVLISNLEQVEEAIKTVNSRSANLKAGYVYVISNIGAFGEDIVKIGMTRRVDPESRISELSGASVPFKFNKHLIHYSEDAVRIENLLHKHFSDKRVNMANARKEFFYASPIEVKEALLRLDGTVTTFIESPVAEDYENSNLNRESVRTNT